MEDSKIIKNIKLVEVKDIWMSRGIRTVDINDDCKTLKEIFDNGSNGVLVKDVSEFGDEEIVSWITKDKFENFKKNRDCKAGDIITSLRSDTSTSNDFDRIPPAATVLAAELKLKHTNTSALPVIAVHFGKEIGMGYITIEDIENIKRKYKK
ncbi:hypothetical protein MSIBF_A4390002 [groundwater metagenome]|uniref:Uncharacterized protein n=1 Tax=groundwater metagenome TaxID=717931 RepID=A0A098EDQ7_9ZZZZ